MKWYDMLWKWTLVNDEMMEVDGMNLGVFVSSYMILLPVSARKSRGSTPL